VTPDEDVTLKFHCHVPTHEQLGMLGEVIVGKGGKPPAHETPPPGTARLFEGIGSVVAVELRNNRLVLTHGEIKGFMAAMSEMSFMVTPTTLLKGIEPGNNVRFTIDADKRAIVNVVRVDR
jgi:Cu/Ag efflux protein CusF